jgi:hypothetical protein
MRIPMLVVALLATLAGIASAQRSPDTATLDRGDGIPRLGVDFGLTLLEAPPYDAVLRIEPYGQYVWRNGLGIYGALPLARSFGGQDLPPPEARNATAIGNFDLGMLYVVDHTPSLSWVMRAGIALPLASDGRPGVLTNALGAPPRLTDLALAVPDAWYVRLAISPLVHYNKLFLRADLGLDLGISDGPGDAPELLRLNVGGGVDLGAVALGLELVTLVNFDAFDESDEVRHALSFTMRFMGEALQPVIAVGLPLDDAVRDRVRLFIAAGIQVVIR